MGSCVVSNRSSFKMRLRFPSIKTSTIFLKMTSCSFRKLWRRKPNQTRKFVIFVRRNFALRVVSGSIWSLFISDSGKIIFLSIWIFLKKSNWSIKINICIYFALALYLTYELCSEPTSTVKWLPSEKVVVGWRGFDWIVDTTSITFSRFFFRNKYIFD